MTQRREDLKNKLLRLALGAALAAFMCSFLVAPAAAQAGCPWLVPCDPPPPPCQPWPWCGMGDPPPPALSLDALLETPFYLAQEGPTYPNGDPCFERPVFCCAEIGLCDPWGGPPPMAQEGAKTCEQAPALKQKQRRGAILPAPAAQRLRKLPIVTTG